jgi:hypothetical protein
MHLKGPNAPDRPDEASTAARAETSARSGSDEDSGIFAVDDDDDEANANANHVDAIAEVEASDDRPCVKQAVQFTKTGLHDMYDDSHGYYNFRVGEVMAGRCAAWGCLGNRTFFFLAHHCSSTNLFFFWYCEDQLVTWLLLGLCKILFLLASGS